MLKSVCTSLSDNMQKKGVRHLYPGITIILEIFLKYRYTGKPDITISWFNDIILTSPWHIVKPGFHCTVKKVWLAICLYFSLMIWPNKNSTNFSNFRQSGMALNGKKRSLNTKPEFNTKRPVKRSNVRRN